MRKKGNISLPELAARYKVKYLYGASVAYFSSEESGINDFRAQSDRICCYELNLIIKGEARIVANGRKHILSAGSLMVLTPYQPVSCDFSDTILSEGLLIDCDFYNDIPVSNSESEAQIPNVISKYNYIYQLNEGQTEALRGIFLQIRQAIQYDHLYKLDMIQSLVHICKLFINELPFETHVITADFRHKENIYKIFLHLSERYFKKERHIQFYADKLNITSTYLSKVVKEISGNTVGEILTRQVFHEACTQLKSSEKTIGEIADMLGFNDQSAFTNFFRMHAKCTPSAYRDNE